MSRLGKARPPRDGVRGLRKFVIDEDLLLRLHGSRLRLTLSPLVDKEKQSAQTLPGRDVDTRGWHGAGRRKSGCGCRARNDQSSLT